MLVYFKQQNSLFDMINIDDDTLNNDIDKLTSIIGSFRSNDIRENYYQQRYKGCDFYYDIPITEYTETYYDKFVNYINDINSLVYKFDLRMVNEPFKILVFKTLNKNLPWNYDLGICDNMNENVTTKLTMIQFLNDYDTEGFDLEVMDKTSIIKIERKKGRVIVFPSFVQYRFTGLKNGIGNVMVMNFHGPRFS